MIVNYGENKQYDLTGYIRDNSVRYRKLKGEDSLTLHFSLDTFVDFPINSWVEYPKNSGLIYTLEKPENFKKKGTENFEYTLILEGAYAKLRKYKFREKTSNRFTKLKFSLTAKPHEHLQMLVDNLNERDPNKGWTVGKCIDAVEKTISYSHNNCEEVFNLISDTFDTEGEVDGKTISICKIEYFKDNPLELSYGKGHGFKPGVGRSNFNDKAPVEILYVQGGERNINFETYKNAELLLPKGQRLIYEDREYIASADGLSIQRYDKGIIFNNEDSLDCSEIYPNKEHIVTGVECIDEKSKWDIFDTNNDVDYSLKDHRIVGETATVIFQSGMLAGKEFELKQTESAITGYIHSEKRFKLVSQDVDGQTMPNKTYAPKQGDKFRLFGISLPPEYVCNNNTKTGGSWDMFREAVRYLYENENPQFTFTGELDGIWAKRHWNDVVNVGGRIKVGAYILFSDIQFNTEGTKIRIVGIKENINNPYSPKIELSNVPVSSGKTFEIAKIPGNEVVVDDKHKDAISFSKRRFRDAKETISMLEESLLENFSESINPIAVQTMSMLVGDESLQFRFVNNKTNPTTKQHIVNYDSASNTLKANAGIIQHMTLGVKSISSEHKSSEYKFWSLAEYNSPTLEPIAKYWLYAKVTDNCRPITSHSQYTGVFVRSDKSIAMNEESGYYYLLVGILNSEYSGSRGDFVSLYGFSEILPGRITTDKIVSSDGLNFLDFVQNAFRVGNNNSVFDWNASVANMLNIKNASVKVVNSAGKTMLYFSGTDGSGQLAGGNISWDRLGNIKAKGGVFTDILLKGSLRSPFVQETDSIVIGGDQSTHDNVATISTGGGWITSGTLEWDVAQGGRRMCITNYRWENQLSQGTIEYDAPSGKYFYEDGVAKNSLTLSRECVELKGYGTKTSFYGWIVLNRVNLGTSARYGRQLNVLAQGFVNGYSSGASVSCKTFDDSTLSARRIGEGQYVMSFPSNWKLEVGGYLVMLTGYGGGLMKATLLSQTTSSFTVEVSDDASRNDGSFQFQIINLNDWT